MKWSKGNADCHLPNDKYRDGWERIFGNNLSLPKRIGDSDTYIISDDGIVGCLREKDAEDVRKAVRNMGAK